MLVFSVLSALPPDKIHTDLLFNFASDINMFYCHRWIRELKFLKQSRLACPLCSVMHLAVCCSFVWPRWGMIEGCFFFSAQLKSHQYNDHSVTAANSSRHTIVCHRNKLRWPEKDKCICVCEPLSCCKLAVDKADR